MPENDQYFELKPVAIADFAPADFVSDPVNVLKNKVIDNVPYSDTNNYWVPKEIGKVLKVIVLGTNLQSGTTGTIRVQVVQYINDDTIVALSDAATFAITTTPTNPISLYESVKDYAEKIKITISATNASAGTITVYTCQY